MSSTKCFSREFQLVNKLLVVYPPTLQLSQFFLCQNPASTLILELCLQLLYFHEETDCIGSDAWTGSNVFLEFNSVMLQEKKRRRHKPSNMRWCQQTNRCFPVIRGPIVVPHLIVGIRRVAGLVDQPVLILQWIAAKLRCVGANFDHLDWW